MNKHFTDEELFAFIENKFPLSSARLKHLERCSPCREKYRLMHQTEQYLRNLQPLRAPGHLPETIVRQSTASISPKPGKTPVLFLSLILMGAVSAWGAGIYISKWLSGNGFRPARLAEGITTLLIPPDSLFHYIGLGLCTIALYLLLDIHKKYKSRLFP